MLSMIFIKVLSEAPRLPDIIILPQSSKEIYPSLNGLERIASNKLDVMVF